MKDEHSVDDESGRLAALKRLAVMDTADEQAYDDITRLAATICKTPMALISLVDDQRQWFKSRVGMQARQTPREHAFCAVALQTPDVTMTVPNTLADPRFADNPLVTGDPTIRFYAGAPLVTSDGHAVGTVCVLDTEPRTLDEDQLQTLRFLAQQVMDLLEQRQAQRTRVAGETATANASVSGGIEP